MAFSNTLPVSEILKSQDTDEPKKKSREDWRKAKELEEARKLGNAPAAVDEEGRDINPHIPQYYFTSSMVATATRYRKGACENCGSITHKKGDCFERPRRIGARFNGADIKADEAIQPNLHLDYDGKRDRWNGYDPDYHKAIIEEHSKIEEAKRQIKADKLLADSNSTNTESNKDQAEGESDEEDDEDKYADDFDMPGTKVDSKQRITVRNLRIREDTAKYLRNLDPNSAHYDPKTRSMRENPYKGTSKSAEEVHFAGENFIRYSGDTLGHSEAQLFAWDAYNKGVDVHNLAEPTKLELLKEEFQHKKEEFKKTVQSTILDKYGGVQHLDAPPREVIICPNYYVEYSRHGKIIKGEDKTITRSKYKEDVYPNNHGSVWGSYWKDGNWGYQCCHSFINISYCTGVAGQEASQQVSLSNLANNTANNTANNEASNDQSNELSKSDEEKEKAMLEQLQHEDKQKLKKLKKKEKKRLRKHKKKEKQKKKKLSKDSSSSSESDDNDDEINSKKLKKALIDEEKNQEAAEMLLQIDERKRKYNSMFSVKEPSKEEVEAFMMKRKRADDPMAQFMD
ncbi:Pre-mRNA-splicing factor SLU7 [Nymphon striatum]|nr:Pre-mRNA-splicing factor SLU7 [Nymphon striatum]